MPDFGSTAANELFADIATPPAPEAPRIAAARRAMERVGSREGRDAVASQLIRGLPLDQDPTADAQAILAVQAELDAADTTLTADDELARQVADALQPEPQPEPPSGPYLDDGGHLRTSDGRVLDTEGAADELQRLATSDHEAANVLLDQLRDADPAMAGQIVAHLGGDD